MQKTKIEWVKNPDGSQGYSWNPVKGLCPNACWYCYARAMYKRFKWDPEIRLDQKELSRLILFKTNYPTSKRIFVGSTIDLFHPEIPKDWIQTIVNLTGLCSEHTFIFLTKNPARYAEFDFPDNCWLGVTVTTCEEQSRIKVLCRRLNSPNVRFVSYEPLLGFIPIPYPVVDWVIVGALTGPRAHFHRPHRMWIELIINKAKRHDIPLFLKDNLRSVWGKDLTQEYPERSK